MPPPQLARDAPIVDVGHPVVVGFGPVVRHERSTALCNNVECRLSQWRDLDKPLGRQQRLDDGSAALTMPDRVHMILDTNEKTLALKL